jgi:hypothetical protein
VLVGVEGRKEEEGADENHTESCGSFARHRNYVGAASLTDNHQLNVFWFARKDQRPARMNIDYQRAAADEEYVVPNNSSSCKPKELSTFQNRANNATVVLFDMFCTGKEARQSF